MEKIDTAPHLTLMQASIAARAFLDREEAAQDFLGLGEEILMCRFELSGYKCVLECCKEKCEQPTSMAWHPWVSAALTGFPPGTIICKDTHVSALQGYRIMQAFIYDCACNVDSAELKLFAETLNDKNIESFENSKQWKYWLLCIDAVLHNKITPGLGLLEIDSAITRQQSLEIMQQFLKNYCLKTKKIRNIEWFEHVQNLRLDSADPMLSDWLAGIPSGDSDKLTIFDALVAMRRFVKIQKMSTKLKDVRKFLYCLGKDQSESMPIGEFGWMDAAYRVIFNKAL